MWQVDLSPILPVLAKVFDQALEGGGAKNINFQELAADLAQITFDYPFRIPPYFALIIRAIGVLEGIALTGNSDFAIVDEAYPYIAQASCSFFSGPERPRKMYLVVRPECRWRRMLLAGGLASRCSDASSWLWKGHGSRKHCYAVWSSASDCSDTPHPTTVCTSPL